MAKSKPDHSDTPPDQAMYPGSPVQPLCQGLGDDPPCVMLPLTCPRLLAVIEHPEANDARVVQVCGGYIPLPAVSPETTPAGTAGAEETTAAQSQES